MKKTEITLPEIGLIAATRGMLGAGIALLLADRLKDDQRKTLGWTLFAIGAVSTIPLAYQVLGKRAADGDRGPEACVGKVEGEASGSWASDRGMG